MPLVRSRLGLYVLREVLPLYLGGLLLFLTLLTTDLISSVAGVFVRTHAPFDLAVQLYLTRLPGFADKALALAVPFAVLLAFGRLSKDSEVKAALAGGVRPLALVTPLVVGALVVGALLFANTSAFTPAGNAQYQTVLTRIFYNTPPNPPQKDLYTKALGGRLYYAGSVRPRPGQDRVADLLGVMVQDQGGTYTAQSGLWDGRAQTWTLYDAWLVTPEGAPRFLRGPSSFPQQDRFALPEPPAEQLSFAALRTRVQDAGVDPAQHRLDVYEFQRRFADALAALGFAFTAGALGLTLRDRAWSFGGLVLLIFAYYVVWSTMPQLVKAAALPSSLAAWLPDLLLVGAGLLFVRRLS